MRLPPSPHFRFPELSQPILKFSFLATPNPKEVAYVFARNVSFHLKSNMLMLSDYTGTFEKDVLPLLCKQNGVRTKSFLPARAELM
jgi:hypothetical protein